MLTDRIRVRGLEDQVSVRSRSRFVGSSHRQRLIGVDSHLEPDFDIERQKVNAKCQTVAKSECSVISHVDTRNVSVAVVIRGALTANHSEYPGKDDGGGDCERISDAEEHLIIPC